MTKAIAQRRLLRARGGHGHHRVTYVELLFDLVFVFAITQLSHALLAHFTPRGAIETTMLLLAVWWAWVNTAWVTNWLDPERTPVRLMLFAVMLAGLAMSTALPTAFGTGGMMFAMALAALQVGRTGFMLWAIPPNEPGMRRNFQRILAWHTVAALAWLAGGLLSGMPRLALWGLAVLLDCAAPALRFWTPWAGASAIGDWNVEGGHMAERCGLFIIIALGESVLVTGATFGKTDWSTAATLAFLVAFAGSLATWWIYFDTGEKLGSASISGAADPGRLARLAYTYLHLPIVAGIIVSAVADEKVLAHPTGHTDAATAISVLGGPLLFLVGTILFKRVLRGWYQLSHLAGIGALLLLAPAALVLPPLAFAAAATLVLVVVAAWESLSFRAKEG
jgi:low temperature requirement protein LtrA